MNISRGTLHIPGELFPYFLRFFRCCHIEFEFSQPWIKKFIVPGFLISGFLILNCPDVSAPAPEPFPISDGIHVNCEYHPQALAFCLAKVIYSLTKVINTSLKQAKMVKFCQNDQTTAGSGVMWSGWNYWNPLCTERRALYDKDGKQIWPQTNFIYFYAFPLLQCEFKKGFFSFYRTQVYLALALALSGSL